MRTKFAKTDMRYWEQKVAFQTPASRTYSVQIQHANQRAWIGLAKANRAQAAFEARKLYLELKANGWEETIARRRKPDAPKRIGTTISDYVDAVRNNTALFPRTIESYNQALRRIAADVHKLASARKAHGVKLSTLTSERIEAWRIDFVRRKSVNPLAEKSARVSANSFIMSARALFSKDVVARIKGLVEVPEPLPFAGVKAEGVRAPRYRSTFDIVQLLESARAELAAVCPEQFKIFLLAAMAGLRRHEIDLLPWSAFRFNENMIRIEATEFFRPKSEGSEGDVLVDPELMEVFRGYHARATGEFVIESDGEPQPGRALRSLSLLGSLPRIDQMASRSRLAQRAQAAAYAAQGIRFSNQREIRTDCRARAAAPRQRGGDRLALHREQDAPCPRLRAPAEERSADRRPDRGNSMNNHDPYEVTYLAIEDIKPSPENEELYGSVDYDEDLGALIGSIEKLGLEEPLIVEADGYILSGHRRFVALIEIGSVQVPCRVQHDVRRGEHDSRGLHAASQRLQPAAHQDSRRYPARDDPARRRGDDRRHAERSPATHRVDVSSERRAGVHDRRWRQGDRPHRAATSGIPRCRRQDRRAHERLLAAVDSADSLSALNNPPLKVTSERSKFSAAEQEERNRYANNLESYRATSGLCTSARYLKHIPFQAVDDSTRTSMANEGSSGVKGFVAREVEWFLTGYELDKQRSQPVHIECFCEKNTLLGIVEPACKQHNVPLTSGRGFAGPSIWRKMAARYRASGRLTWSCLPSATTTPRVSS